MTYSLYRISDGAGDSGPMSMALWKDETGNVQYEHNAVPRVGVAMRVGSLSGRTYDTQDWWQTTYITEIISESESKIGNIVVSREIRFKTKNSEYIWKEF